MNRQEVQYALDRRGYIDIDEAMSMDGHLELGHLTGRVHVVSTNGSTISNDGPSGRHLFEFNYLDSYTHDPAELYFYNVVHDNNATHSGFFRVNGNGTPPAKLEFDNCLLQASGNYAIDCPSGGEMEGLVVERTEFQSGGAIRWHSPAAAYPDFVHLISNRYTGTFKPGSTFNFKNVQNLTMRLNILDGNVKLIDELIDSYNGPVAIKIVNPRGVCTVDNFWFEPWSDWDVDAPDCWGFSVRTDDDTGSFGQRTLVTRNITLNADGLGAGVKLNHFIGGGASSNAASMLVYLTDDWKAADVDYLFGGKIRVIMERNADNSDMDDDIEATIDGIIADSYRDPLKFASGSLPFNEFSDNEAGGIAYPGGTTLDENWVDKSQELEAY